MWETSKFSLHLGFAVSGSKLGFDVADGSITFLYSVGNSAFEIERDVDLLYHISILLGSKRKFFKLGFEYHRINLYSSAQIITKYK